MIVWWEIVSFEIFRVVKIACFGNVLTFIMMIPIKLIGLIWIDVMRHV